MYNQVLHPSVCKDGPHNQCQMTYSVLFSLAYMRIFVFFDDDMLFAHVKSPQKSLPHFREKEVPHS